jgi:hypothetical protein
MYDHKEYRTGSLPQKAAYWLHAFMIPLGAFFFVGGTYGVIEQIIEAYADGQIGEYGDGGA